MKVFISGPMAGYPDFNREAFFEAEKKLRGMGFDVFNPAWLNFTEGWTKSEMLKIDISALSECDAMLQLNGWDRSKGCAVEYGYALYHGIYIFEEKDFFSEIVGCLIGKEKTFKEFLLEHGKWLG